MRKDMPSLPKKRQVHLMRKTEPVLGCVLRHLLAGGLRIEMPCLAFSKVRCVSTVYPSSCFGLPFRFLLDATSLLEGDVG